jgi:uncharacterized delta-60 repeat protein
MRKKNQLLILLISLALFVVPVSAAPGDLDPSFGSGGTAIDYTAGTDIRKVILQPDGKIIVIGSRKVSIPIGSTPVDYLFVRRYTSTGAVDTSFGGLRRGIGYDAEVQPDGKVVVLGSAPNTVSSPFGGTYNVNSPVVWRFNSNGTTDTGFGSSGARFIGVAESGNFNIDLFAGSIFISYAGRPVYLFTTTYRVSRLASDGTVNLTVTLPFTYSSGETAFAMNVDQSSGDIVVGGPRSSDQNAVLRRYTQNGDVVSSFGVNGEAVVPDCYASEPSVKDLVIQPDGNILVYRYTGPSYVQIFISRQTSNGSPTGLCYGTYIPPAVGSELYLQPDGKFFFFIGFNVTFHRFFGDGTFDTHVYPGTSAPGVIQPDLKIVNATEYGDDQIVITRRFLN